MTDGDHFEYGYDANGEIQLAALIDNKHGNAKELSMHHSPMKAQLKAAEKMEIPLFMAISFLHEATPCYYVIACNQRATETMRLFGCKSDQEWFSIKRYSQLQHHFRGLSWNQHEVTSNKTGKKLSELPDSFQPYKLPSILIQSTTF